MNELAETIVGICMLVLMISATVFIIGMMAFLAYDAIQCRVRNDKRR